ncbi:hypothetical protein Tco_0720945 [Tanacetum coccineum]
MVTTRSNAQQDLGRLRDSLIIRQRPSVRCAAEWRVEGSRWKAVAIEGDCVKSEEPCRVECTATVYVVKSEEEALRANVSREYDGSRIDHYAFSCDELALIRCSLEDISSSKRLKTQVFYTLQKNKIKEDNTKSKNQAKCAALLRKYPALQDEVNKGQLIA